MLLCWHVSHCDFKLASGLRHQGSWLAPPCAPYPACGADGQHDGDHGWQALRDDGHSDGNSRLNGSLEGLPGTEHGKQEGNDGDITATSTANHLPRVSSCSSRLFSTLSTCTRGNSSNECLTRRLRAAPAQTSGQWQMQTFEVHL
jgi:hypothetical protein